MQTGRGCARTSSKTRKQAIAQIHATIERLPDDRLETLAELAETWTEPSVYSSLSSAEKSEINAALDDLDRGEGIDWKLVKSKLDAQLKAAGA